MKTLPSAFRHPFSTHRPISTRLYEDRPQHPERPPSRGPSYRYTKDWIEQHEHEMDRIYYSRPSLWPTGPTYKNL